MVFLILESLGSTELIFILLMALVFFGPRKLPQLSRTLGKNLASFRRASEDFKRTWDREVTLEEFAESAKTTPLEKSSVPGEPNSQTIQPPAIEPVSPELVVARNSDETPAVVEPVPEGSSKRDWL